MEAFKFISVACLCVLLSACTSTMDTLNRGMTNLDGQPVQKAFDVFGFPDDEDMIADHVVYSWDRVGYFRNVIPQTSTISTPQGTSTVRYDQSVYDSYFCRLRIITRHDTIMNWDVSSSGGGCSPYAERLKAYYDLE